jgi:hypothetical protein
MLDRVRQVASLAYADQLEEGVQGERRAGCLPGVIWIGDYQAA